ncbi:hypothetical protein [Nocardia bovistercoris]|uniref:DUF4254 domain-containing protein n=1 Tax=Nocardia bovistercoris TaxID=2785916 RepID=A0A931N3B7_9NOCA|nr:hypothetical protein [Nocardia bovistercoris]MBH0777709.1 hypothetical protein [Nocardia bovistercoris]
MAGPRPLLPSRDELLAACRGFPGVGDDPVSTAAAELAVLHRRRERIPYSALADSDTDRAARMREIDAWTRLVIPEPARDARLYPLTMGQVIDRLAESAALTHTVLAEGSDRVFWEASETVDDLAHAYSGLVARLLAGTRRLPPTFSSP